MDKLITVNESCVLKWCLKKTPKKNTYPNMESNQHI